MVGRGEKLVAKKEYNEAYRHYAYLLQNSRRSPKLLQSVRKFVFENAEHAYQEKRYDYALALLEELHRSSENYRRAEVIRGISRIANVRLKDAVDQGDYRTARGVLRRMTAQYQPGLIPSLTEWRERFERDAETRKIRAEKLLAEGKYREAQQVGRSMINIWPELPGARELVLDLARRHPMVIVGVDQLAKYRDIRRIDNWPARRAGRLTQQTLLEFVGAGPEGGQYQCSIGKFEQNDFRTQLSLKIVPPDDPEDAVVTGFDVAQRLLGLANPDHPEYFPAWASLTRQISVRDVFRVDIDLRRPHVLPEGMLQIVLHPDPKTRPIGSPSEGAFVVAEETENETAFLANPRFQFSKEDHLQEIVERKYDNLDEAILALRRGDIDVLDRVFPAEVAELQTFDDVQVDSYASPTVHCLVPNYEHPYPGSQIFRRAVMYGINRSEILKREILGNYPNRGFRVISGPFPIGVRENDPLSYAYDISIASRKYDPQLSVVLQEMSKREQKEIANRRDEEPPEIGEMTIVHPQDQVARVACQSIATYLTAVNIPCKLKELPPGVTRPQDDDWDFFYVQAAVWEPIIDARRLLGPHGVAGIEDEYVGMGLRLLDQSRNWREARTRLHNLHRIVYERLAVLPLWQTVNYFAYYKGLEGFGAQPATLYQTAERWKVVPRLPRE